MIISEQIIRFCEELFAMKNIYGKEVVLYINPTVKDYNRLYSSKLEKTSPNIRYLADGKEKNFYVWNAYLARHYEIEQSRGMNARINWAYGELFISGRGVRPILINILVGMHQNKDDEDWSWITKYTEDPHNLLKEVVYVHREKHS